MNAYFCEKNELENYLQYLQEREPYCREERQFAALLYSVFLKKREKGKIPADKITEDIVEACLGSNDIIIEDVYFEATLMRDFFERNREGFNKKLLNFVLGEEKALSEKYPEQLKTYNLGGKAAKTEIEGIIRSEIAPKGAELPAIIQGKEVKAVDRSEDMILIKKKLRLDIAGMMMNATPDILVKYRMKETDGKSYVKALECKYKSGEGEYTSVGVTCKMQFFIQECIMCFLFGHRTEEDIYYPEQPKGGAWREKKGKEGDEYEKRKGNVWWNEIFMSVFKDIIEQESRPGKNINAGVQVIRFAGSNEKEKKIKKKQIKKQIKEKQIKIKDLLDAVYENKMERQGDS